MSGYLTRPADRVVHRDDRALILRNGTAACHYCTEPEAGHVDHIVPSARGGMSDQANYVPACSLCNHEKRNLSPEQWPPRSRYAAMVEMLEAIPRAEMILVDAMLADTPARPVPYVRWMHEWGRRVHRGYDAPLADEVAGYLAAVPTDRDDGAFFYGDVRWTWGVDRPETAEQEHAWLVEQTAAELDAWVDGRRSGSPGEVCGLMLRRRDELTPGGRASRNERELADLLAEGPSDVWPSGDDRGQHGWIVGVVQRHLAEARAEPDARRLTFADRLRLAEYRETAAVAS